MTFKEKLSIEINVKNVDMFAQAHGTADFNRLPTYQCILAMQDIPLHQKSFLMYCAMDEMPDLKTQYDIKQEFKTKYYQQVSNYKKMKVEPINLKLTETDINDVIYNSIYRVVHAEDANDKFWSIRFHKSTVPAYCYKIKSTFEWMTLELKNLEADIIKMCNRELSKQNLEVIK